MSLTGFNRQRRRIAAQEAERANKKLDAGLMGLTKKQLAAYVADTFGPEQAEALDLRPRKEVVVEQIMAMEKAAEE